MHPKALLTSFINLNCIGMFVVRSVHKNSICMLILHIMCLLFMAWVISSFQVLMVIFSIEWMVIYLPINPTSSWPSQFKLYVGKWFNFVHHMTSCLMILPHYRCLCAMCGYAAILKWKGKRKVPGMDEIEDIPDIEDKLNKYGHPPCELSWSSGWHIVDILKHIPNTDFGWTLWRQPP